MEVRFLNENDFETLANWWKQYNWVVPNKDFLPQNGLGGMMGLSDTGDCVCAGFLYLTNSGVAWLEYLISNPNYREDNRGEIIDGLIFNLIDIAESKGYKYIFTVAKNDSIKNVFERNNFKIGTENTTEMIYICNQ